MDSVGLLRGDRPVLTGLISVFLFAITYALTSLNVLEIGGNSTISSLLGGAIAGLLTVIVVTLSISQLALSRMFGSSDELRGQLAGATDFRRTVERAADEPTSPVEPIEFFAMIADTLRARSARLSDTATDADGDLRGVLEKRSVELGEYADRIDATLEASGMRMRTRYPISRPASTPEAWRLLTDCRMDTPTDCPTGHERNSIPSSTCSKRSRFPASTSRR